jgi:hypothetical protein
MGSGHESKSAVEAYLRTDMQLDQWLDEGARPDDFETVFQELPMEHQFMLFQWKEAFPFWRMSLYEYSERILGISPWTSTIRSVLARLRATNPNGVAAFEQLAFQERERAAIQLRNAVERYDNLARERTRDSVRGLLNAYADVYEVDLTLWYLGVLARAYLTSEFDLDAFGGPRTRTAQAALIGQVEEALLGTPFAPMFAEAYDPVLRNAIGHNDYDLRPSGDTFEVREVYWPAVGPGGHRRQANQFVHSLHGSGQLDAVRAGGV